ncbi:unnamed protein product [Rotaria sordida]|uniref:Phospholipid scramblase n=1 Tax=Rotaria sordida TaxID=392033 RepID=A0A814JFX5_9BILA|nr:unnamed protein product [Rotaria sordida]
MAQRYYVDDIERSYGREMTSIVPHSLTGRSGIDCLRMLDSLFVKQIPSISEAIFGIAAEAKFDIFNDRKEQLFQAFETSSFCQRLFCTSRRQFILRIVDNSNQEIILVKREFKCCSGCCWCANATCCSQEVTVESPPGTLIGTVSQEGSCWRLRLAIKDANDTTILTVRGPGCICDGSLACCCEMPRDLDSKIKAVTLGALILIDFIFFGTVPDRNND